MLHSILGTIFGIDWKFSDPIGPLPVGFCDWLTAGPVKQSVVVRLFYPAADESRGSESQWLDDDYFVAMIHFAENVFRHWPSWAPTAEFPTFALNQWICRHFSLPRWLTTGIARVMNKYKMPVARDAKPRPTDARYPVVVLSHGLGVSRHASSRLCYDLASNGFVVAAVEHRDGSAAHSVGLDDRGKVVAIDHDIVQVDDVGSELMARQKQLDVRVAEILKTIECLKSLASTKSSPDLDNKIQHVSPTSNYCPINSGELGKVIDVEHKLSICGHSFGGATVLATAARANENDRQNFNSVVALDPWLFALQQDSLAHYSSSAPPTLVINSDSFRTDSNLAKLAELRTDLSDSRHEFYVMRGSRHLSYCDAPYLIKREIFQRLLSTYTPMGSEVCARVTAQLLTAFFRKHCKPTAVAKADDHELIKCMKRQFLQAETFCV